MDRQTEIPCFYRETSAPIEKQEVKWLFHGWPNEAVFEVGCQGYLGLMLNSTFQGIVDRF